jgi:PilZ domain
MPGTGHFRAHARRRIHLAVSVRQANRDDDAIMVDLGLAGACVELARPLPIDSRLVLRVVAPTLWDPLVLEGLIVWAARRAARFRAGIRFQHADEHALGALFELLAAQDYET